MPILIAGARVIDPGHMDDICDLLIEGDHIRTLQPPGTTDPSGERLIIIDARGLWLTPGLVDMHVHFREPGQEHKETILTGARAAAAGGFTSVCTMPNTDPANDCEAVTRFILDKADQANLVRVYPAAAVSLGLAGRQLSDFDQLKAAGAVGVSDDGQPVSDSRMMRQALERAATCGLRVISHCEEMALAAHGDMNEGPVCTKLALVGIPNAAESIMVMRDIALAELTGVPVHIAHVSTRQSVAAIRRAKADGIRVTAETAPHYFSLTDEAVLVSGTHAKMNPPLRSQQDRQAIRDGLVDGAIDAIATDHAPHSSLEKDVAFHNAANGIIGLETALPLGLKLVAEGVLTESMLIERMCHAPARILGLETGLQPGRRADLTLIDPHMDVTVHSDSFCSKSRNTPFEGWRLRGKAVLTMVGGRVVYHDPDRVTLPGGRG